MKLSVFTGTDVIEPQHYLDQLSSERYTTLRALEKLERRVAEIHHDRKKYFQWVREVQDTEEAHRESEKKKIKQEAVIFKRHEKQMQRRIKELKQKENAKRQELALDKALEERSLHMAEEELQAQWDPIEDVMEQERETYIDLIRLFLNMETSDSTRDSSQPTAQQATDSNPTPNGTKAKKKKKPEPADTKAQQGADKPGFETASRIKERLKAGEEMKYGAGRHLVGSLRHPAGLKDNIAPVPEDEIDQLLSDLVETKLLAFCRVVLSQAPILRAAMDAQTVEEFLYNPEVTIADLRDLVLRLEDLQLQEIRDACADFGRSEEDNDSSDDNSSSDNEVELSGELRLERKLRAAPPGRGKLEVWKSKSERQAEKLQGSAEVPEQMQELLSEKEELSQTMIDFGVLDDGKGFQSKKVVIKVCGKHI